MKYIIYFVFLGNTFISCDWIHKKSPDQEVLFKEEMAKIDWKNVDESASLVSCDSISDLKLKETCLLDELTKFIHYKLNNQSFIIDNFIADTLWVALELKSDSTIAVVPKMDMISDEQVKFRIDSILKSKLDSLPKIYPAIKRGIPVTTQINLPIIINK